MLKEIKRTTWTKFLKKFSAENQYRYATVTVSHRGKASVVVNEYIPFMGVGLSRKGRRIAGVNLYVGHWSPEQLHNPTVAITQPARLMLEPGTNSASGRLVVEGEDGSRVDISFEDNRVEPRTVVEKLAYTFAERRGFQPGSDVENWLEAEQAVRQLEHQLI